MLRDNSPPFIIKDTWDLVGAIYIFFIIFGEITKSVVENNPKTKKNIGAQYTNNYESTFTFDSKGNWTKWKVKKISGNRYDSESFTITRTITYYTDEEVKKAVSELEQARKGSTTNNNQKKEDLWEF